METENNTNTQDEYNGTADQDYLRREFDVKESPPDEFETELHGNQNKPPYDELTEPERALIIPHRKLLKVIRYFSRSNKAALLAGILTISVLIMFGIAFMQEQMGQFTINLNRVDMWRRAISMSETADFTNPTSRLTVNTIKRTTNISINDIPWDTIDEGDGDKSGKDYIAYSFYIRNGGIEDIDCNVALKMDYKSKGAENAVRLAVILDGEKTIYAMPAKNGEAEPDTTPFESDTIVMQNVLKDFKIDAIHKYTIVMWLEGDDPECINDIIGGSVRFSMDFDTGESRDVSLWEFIKNLPLFRGAAEDDGLGSKDNKDGLWADGNKNTSQSTEQTENSEQNNEQNNQENNQENNNTDQN